MPPPRFKISTVADAEFYLYQDLLELNWNSVNPQSQLYVDIS